MYAQRHIGPDLLQQPVLDHALCAAHGLVRWLEDEGKTPRDAVAVAHQHLGDSGDNGCVSVVAAAMVAVLKLRGIRMARRLCHGQRIYIGAYEQGLARVGAFEYGQHARAADAFLDDGTEGAHAPCQRRGGPHLFKGQLWMLMQLPSQCDQAWFERLDVMTEVDECRHTISPIVMSETSEVEQLPLAMCLHSHSEKYSVGYCDGAVSRTTPGAHRANVHTVPPPGACPGGARGSRARGRSISGPTTPTRRCEPGSYSSPTGGLPG